MIPPLLLGFQEHDIAALLAARLLAPLGKPAPNAPKYFAAVDVEACTHDREWLSHSTRAISKYSQEKNQRKSSSASRRSRPQCLLACFVNCGKLTFMTYPVVVIESEEGFAVGCPALPGCWSQGRTRDEALASIREAIALWKEVEEEDIQRDLEASGASYSRELVTV